MTRTKTALEVAFLRAIMKQLTQMDRDILDSMQKHPLLNINWIEIGVKKRMWLRTRKDRFEEQEFKNRLAFLCNCGVLQMIEHDYQATMIGRTVISEVVTPVL